jgi:hypothetical protein
MPDTDRKEYGMTAIRGHFAEHRSHLLACAFAAVLIVTGIAVGFGALVVLGAVMCGVMMVGMVWMMVSIVRHR